MSSQARAYSSITCIGAICFGISFIFLGTYFFWIPCMFGVFLMLVGGIGAARYRSRCHDQYICAPCTEDGRPTYIAVPQPYYQTQPQQQPYAFAYPADSYMQPQAGQPQQYPGYAPYQAYPPPPYAPQH